VEAHLESLLSDPEGPRKFLFFAHHKSLIQAAERAAKIRNVTYIR
jgi:hypothetical protein